MSSNRLMYDTCEYKTRLNENLGTLEYMLDNARYENCGKCRMELGIIGGSNVSHIKGNLVDLETELRGTSRMNSKCPTKKYQNQFAERVQAIEAQKAQAQASLVQAQDLFNSLLQRAFKGELTS